MEGNLLGGEAGERFRYHDLARAHAREHARSDPHADLCAAVLRVTEWYLERAVAAELALSPDRSRFAPRYEAAIAPFSHVHRASDWLEAERVNLVSVVRTAADHGWHDLAWQLVEVMWGFFPHRRHLPDWIAVHEAGVRAARAAGNATAEHQLGMRLVIGYLKDGRLTDAVREAERAVPSETPGTSWASAR